LENCQQGNEIRRYLFLEDQNCAQYFPNLIAEQSGVQSLEIEFLAFFHALLKENPSFEAILKEEAPSGNMDVHAQKSLLKNAEVRKYLQEYGYDIESSGYLIALKKGEEVVAEIFWNDEEKVFSVNLLGKELLFPLAGFSARQKEFTQNEFASERAKFLKEIQSIESGSLPRENILLIGEQGGNTDTLILFSLDHVKKTVTLISLPRDLWIETQKINAIAPRFGIPALKEKLEELLGQEIHRYITINMLAFPLAIDAIGGIDIILQRSLIDPKYRTVNEEGEEGTLYYKAGWHHLRGVEALRVARSRQTTSDFDRAKRQQQVIESAITKMKKRKFDSLVALTPILLTYVKTDFSPEELVALFWKGKEYAVRRGAVMSTGNILESTMFDLGNGSRTYILQPKDEDWSLLPKFVWNTMMQR